MKIKLYCNLTKLQFQSTKIIANIHPQVELWKASASKNGWYEKFFEACEYGVINNYQTFAEFETLFKKAEKNQPIEENTPPVPFNPDQIWAKINLAFGGAEWDENSFLLKIDSVDTSIESIESLIGTKINYKAEAKIAEGLYLRCCDNVYELFYVNGKENLISLYSVFTPKIDLDDLELIWEHASVYGAIAVQAVWLVFQNKLGEPGIFKGVFSSVASAKKWLPHIIEWIPRYNGDIYISNPAESPLSPYFSIEKFVIDEKLK
jgi:hypothetical protein